MIDLPAGRQKNDDRVNTEWSGKSPRRRGVLCLLYSLKETKVEDCAGMRWGYEHISFFFLSVFFFLPYISGFHCYSFKLRELGQEGERERRNYGISHNRDWKSSGNCYIANNNKAATVHRLELACLENVLLVSNFLQGGSR